MTTWFNDGRAASAKPLNPMYKVGKKLLTVHSVVQVDVSELTDGDVFVLAENLDGASRIHRIMTPEPTPALAAATDNDFGFYQYDIEGNLEAVDVDVLVDGANLSSSVAQGDLLRLNASLDRKATINSLLGRTPETAPAGGYVLAMTMNTKATTTDRTLDLDIIIEEATTA